MELEEANLHTVDWIIFVGMLLISTAIGIYHSCTGGKQRTTDEYLRGGKDIGVIPAALSLTVSFVSSIMIIGWPAEVYTFGGQYFLGGFGFALGYLLCAFIYVPVLYPLKTTTANEYIELRYRSKWMRLIIGLYTIFQAMFYASVVAFGQGTTIEAVSGFPVWATIIIAMVASVLYTALGGLRGVIWTDVFQTVIVLVGLIVILVIGMMKVGGFTDVFEINDQWGRMKVFDFDPTPTKRVNFWGVIFGNALTAASLNGHRQEGYQRYAAMPTINKAKLVVSLPGPGNIIIGALVCMLGWTIFAYFADIGCDPLRGDVVDNSNQLLPYFVTTVLDAPGLPGLFLACVAAGALSTISSILNGSAAIIWSDVVRPFIKVDDAKATRISKGLVVIFGAIIFVMAIFVERLGGNLTQMFGTFSSAIVGPMSGVFLVGMFFPWSNAIGSSVGCVVGSVFSLWVGFGSYSIDRHISKLPSNITNCGELMSTTPVYNSFTTEFFNTTTMTQPVTDSLEENFEGVERLYALSFLWLREAATTITIVVAIIVSFISGATDPKTVDAKVLHPWIRGCFNKDLEESNGDIKHMDLNGDMKYKVSADTQPQYPPESEITITRF